VFYVVYKGIKYLLKYIIYILRHDWFNNYYFLYDGIPSSHRYSYVYSIHYAHHRYCCCSNKVAYKYTIGAFRLQLEKVVFCRNIKLQARKTGRIDREITKIYFPIPYSNKLHNFIYLFFNLSMN